MKKRDLVDVFGRMTPIEYKKLEDDTAGHFDRETKSIAISDDEKGAKYVHTLLHELGHALMDRVGIHQAISDETEEIIAENYATMITELFDLKWKP